VNSTELQDLSYNPDHEFVWQTVFGDTPSRVIGDRDLLHAVVRFANGESVADQFIRAGRLVEMTGSEGRIEVTDAEIDAAIARDRSQARQLLHAAIEDLPFLLGVLTLFTKLHPGGFGIVRRPSFGTTSTGEIGVEWVLDLDDAPHSGGRRFDHALAYTAALLYSDEFQCRSKLRCCKLESCGQFFYFDREPGKAGRPRDSFCSTEHAAIAHQKDSARRHREAKRKRIEAAEARKKQRRRHK
jgi:hypothetical protein